jgi:2'-5' RNA ligase
MLAQDVSPSHEALHWAHMHDDLFGYRSPPAGEAVVHNVFFALMPDETTCGRTAQAVESLRARHVPQGRWLSPSRYHMTLHFLGTFSELPRERIDAACAAAAKVHLPAFDLVLDRAGHFPKGIGWLGCAQTGAPLQRLWEVLRRELAHVHVGVQGHSAFKPHVTILRDAREALPAQPIEAITWPVREFVLVDSRLGERNEYRPLGRWPLVHGD